MDDLEQQIEIAMGSHLSADYHHIRQFISAFADGNAFICGEHSILVDNPRYKSDSSSRRFLYMGADSARAFLNVETTLMTQMAEALRQCVEELSRIHEWHEDRQKAEARSAGLRMGLFAVAKAEAFGCVEPAASA